MLRYNYFIVDHDLYHFLPQTVTGICLMALRVKVPNSLLSLSFLLNRVLTASSILAYRALNRTTSFYGNCIQMSPMSAIVFLSDFSLL